MSVSLRRGWFGQRDRYEIESLTGYRGTKCLFTIDATNGAILHEGYIPM